MGLRCRCNCTCHQTHTSSSGAEPETPRHASARVPTSVVSMCLHRLKVQGPFYDEFAQRPADAKPSATPLQLTSGTAAARPQAESLETVLKSVQGAVLAVLGAAVGPDKPLMEAGLDSLGEAADN